MKKKESKLEHRTNFNSVSSSNFSSFLAIFRKYLSSLSFVSHFIRANLSRSSLTNFLPMLCVQELEREAWRKFWSVELRAPF